MERFESKKHVLFALRHVKYLPTPYTVEDANRMTLGYFCLSSLALLPSPAVDETTSTDSALETMLRPVQRQGFIDWVYQQQSTSTLGGGFRGSDSIIDDKEELNRPNLIQSYTALLILALLKDDLIKLDRFKLLNFLQKCQQLDGSFTNSYCTEGEEEPGDPRTSYAAFSICSLLNDWNFIDVDKGLKFLNSCRNQQGGGGGGGFGQRPFSEANAGPTYCAIACYKLCGRIKQIENKKSLLRWLINLQQQQQSISTSSSASSSSSGSTPCSSIESRSDDDDDDDDESASVMDHDCAGFQGRVNKPLDACYSFWSLGALKLLLSSTEEEEEEESEDTLFHSIVNTKLCSNWLLNCQHSLFGGISREPGPDSLPDVYHTYLSLAALSIGQPPSTSTSPLKKQGEEGEEERGLELGLRRLDVGWNVEITVANEFRAKIKQLQEQDHRAKMM